MKKKTDRRRPKTQSFDGHSREQRSVSRHPDSSSHRSRRTSSPRRQRYDAEITVSGRTSLFSWRKVPLLLAVLIIVGVGAYALRLTPDSTVRFSGQYYEQATGRTEQLPTVIWDSAEYKAVSDALMRESILSRTKLTMRTDRFADKFLAEFPEVGAVEVRLQVFDDRPSVTVIPRTPRYVLEDGRRGGESLLVDERGIAMARFDGRLKLDDLVIINDFVADDDELGAQVLPLDTIAFIEGLLYQMIQQYDVDESAIVVALPALANEVHLQLPDDDFIGKFDVTKPVREQAGVFIATRNSLAEEDITPDEYIDARVEGRAFYR